MSQLKPFFLTVTDLAKVLFISRPPKMAIYAFQACLGWPFYIIIIIIIIIMFLLKFL